MRKSWDDVEKDAVRRLYPIGGATAVQVELPHRGRHEIRSYARRNRISTNVRVITPAMADEVLHLYRTGGMPAVRGRWPDMPDQAVRSLAHRRRIKREPKQREVKVKKERVYGRPFKPRPTLLKRSFGEMRQSAVLRKWFRPEKTGPLVATIGGVAA